MSGRAGGEPSDADEPGAGASGAGAPGLDICVESPLWAGVDCAALAGAAREACAARTPAIRAGGEITLVLCDDAAIAEINAQWRGKAQPTNVLSFPAPAPLQARHMGDIIVAYETVAREAADEGKRFEEHFMHMLTHGMLHLAGYDHIEPEEAETMEALERAILASLGIADPYAPGEPGGRPEGTNRR